MNKKILICNPFISLGGIGTFTLLLGKGFRRLNYEVIILCTHYKGDYWEKGKTIFNKQITLSKVKNPFIKLNKILMLINELKPDVIIINNCPPINYTLPFIKPTVKIISVIHSDDCRFYKLDSRFSGWIDHLICPSLKLTEKILKFLPKEDFKKVAKIAHGVEITKNINLENRIEYSLIFVGNIDKHKGVDLLIPILKNIVIHFESTILYIVGKGPLKKKLIFDVEENKLTKNVIFIEELDNEKLKNLFMKVEILLFPTKLESFGLVIPEAMASGVIPVISNLQGITDQFIQNNVNGFLCNKNKPEEFSRNIISVFNDTKLKKFISNNAYNFVLHEYSDFKMIENYETLLNNIIQIETQKKRYNFNWIKLYFNNFINLLRNE